jgi:acyl carrier protein
VDTSEIESVLVQSSVVKEAIVVARADSSGEQRLVGYCVPDTNQPLPTIRKLRTIVSERLPPFMVPSAWVLMRYLPLTATGKVDLRSLPDPANARLAPDNPFLEALDPLQFQLSKTWMRLLNLQRVGIWDNFFDLGGDSLLAVHLLAEVEQRYGKRLSVSTLLSRPTIESLGVAILEHDGQPTSPFVQVQPGAGKLPFFFLHGDLSGGGLFCIPLARHLGAEQPFYAVTPHGGFGDSLPVTVESMAEEYLGLLRTIQPEGPYFLGGYCNGALVALEVARQLDSSGSRIGLLLLAEPPLPIWLGPLATTAMDGSPLMPLPSSGVFDLSEVAPKDRVGLVLRAYQTIFARYRFRPLPRSVPAVVLFPAEMRRASPDPVAGWVEMITGKMILHQGKFHTTITSMFPWFSETVKNCLRQAQG